MNLHKDESKTLFNRIPENSPGYCYIKDLQGIYCDANLAFMRLFNCQNTGELFGKTFGDFSFSYYTAFDAHDQSIIKTGIAQQFIDYITLPNQSILKLFSERIPIKDTDDNCIGVMTTALSIPTEVTLSAIGENTALEHKILNKHYEVSQYLRGIVDSMPGCVYWKDANHRYLGANQFCLEQLGLAHFEDILGKVDEELWGSDRAEFLRYNDRAVMNSGKTILYEEPTTINGKTFIFMAAKMPLKDSEGNIIGIIGNSIDITELKATQAALEQAKRRAEQANLAKSEFLATMSHELRTPLNAIMGMAQILCGKLQKQELREYADIIYKSGLSLLSLINDVLDFARLDAGTLKLLPSAFDLRSLIEDLVYNLKHQLLDKPIELIMDYNPVIPHLLVGDSKRVRQILINLIGNAIKFTKKGYILVSVEALKQTKDRISLQLSVEDTGIGIDKAHIHNIFEKFTQIDTSYSRQHEGSGLGLSIVKQLVTMMGGEIHVNAQENKGSIFWVNLPFLLQSSTKNLQLWQDYEPNVRVLITTDHPAHTKVLSKQLGGAGTVVPGNEAISVLEMAAAQNNAYHVLLIDQTLRSASPKIIIQTIKNNVLFSTIMPLAFSKHIDQHAHEKLAADGYFSLIELPILPSDFLLQLKHHWEHWKATKEAESHSIKTSNIKVLLVEDNVLNQKVAKLLLDEMHCFVAVAADAMEALQHLSREQYDFIFMDISLPGEDGIALTKKIRKMPHPNANRPIIAMTAHVLKREKENAVTAGMNDILLKPLIREQLQHILYKWRGKQV